MRPLPRFVAAGVPLALAFVGRLADVSLRDVVEARARRRSALGEGAYDSMRTLRGATDSDGVDFGEFLALELVRRGVASFSDVGVVKAAFDVLDVDARGTLDRAEVVRFQKTAALRTRYARFLVERRHAGRRAARGWDASRTRVHVGGICHVSSSHAALGERPLDET